MNSSSALALVFGVCFVAVQIEVIFGAPTTNDDPALLVISFDAFRPDYFERNVTPNLNKIRQDGLSAPFLLNVFPTKTFVNHHTIATGLYPGVHGILANEGYDSEIGRVVDHDLFHYNESIVPIWIANELAGKHSGCMMWPGSQYPYGGHKPTYSVAFDSTVDIKTRVDIVFKWLTDKTKPANLVMLYIEQPDTHSHIWGPDSKIVTETVAQLDKLSGYIHRRISELGLAKRLNVIHLSDHGMSSVSPPNFIDLRPFMKESTYTTYGTSPILQIVPKNSALQADIFTNLTRAAKENGHFKVYDRQNLPPQWHIHNDRRMGPILAVSDVDYAFHDMIATAKEYEKIYNIPITNTTKYGIHGYDVTEDIKMRAIFMAKGPLFPPGTHLKQVNNIDLYNFFCHILNIKCDYNGIRGKSNVWEELQHLRSSINPR